MTRMMQRDLLAPIAACLLGACGSPPAPLFFTVGGTVSGLTGTIELRLDDGAPYAVAMNGPFTFPTELEDGASFIVTVSAYPAGQHCTVDGGSGTVSGADVTSVTVACTTDPLYAIGGTVSGLVGALTLRDAQAGEISITADGAFTLPIALPDGAAYDVQIATPEPLQRCAASDASGSVDGADVSAVRIVCTDKAWHHPSSATDFVSPDTGETGRPSVAVDSEGNGYLVWIQGDGTSDCTGEGLGGCAVVYLLELHQGVPVELQQLNGELPRTGPYRDTVRVAVMDGGDVIVTWTQRDPSTSTECAGVQCPGLFVAERRGGTWNLPTSFDDAINLPGGVIYGTALAAAGDSAVIAWDHDEVILLSEYDGGVWTHPTSVDDAISPAGSRVGNPTAAMDAAGNAIVVWDQGAPCGDVECFQVYFSERRGGSWRHPASIEDHVSFSDTHAGAARVVMHGGRALIVWVQSGIGVFLSEHDGTSWTHPASRDDAISPEGMRVRGLPRAAMSATGAVVSWAQDFLFADDCPDPEACQYAFVSERSAEGWIHPAALSDAIFPPLGVLDAADVAMDDRGRILLTWLASDGASYFTQMADRRRGVLMSARVPGADMTSYPAVALSASGNALIAWSGPTDAGRQIFMSHFD